MASAISSTSWPSTLVSQEGKSLINHFFTLADTKSPDSGERLANEVFTENGIFIAANGPSTGRAGETAFLLPFNGSCINTDRCQAISKSRERVWDVIASRQHEVIKVYSSDAEGRDLLVIGKLTAGLSSGKKAEVEFAGRIVMEETVDGLRISLYQVWSVSSSFPCWTLGDPMLAGLRKGYKGSWLTDS